MVRIQANRSSSSAVHAAALPILRKRNKDTLYIVIPRLMQSEIRDKLDNIRVTFTNGHRLVRCFCGQDVGVSIVDHLRKCHSQEWEKWCSAFVKLRNEGLSFYGIICRFKTRDAHFLFTSSVAQKEVQRMLEEETVELRIPRKEKVLQWEPENLEIGRGTVWTFKNRGNWAVHKGDYRGNWPPEIPRILINRYTKKSGEIVLDPFVGGGTTLIEAWLADRKSFGIDINPVAVTVTNARIQEMSDHAQSDGKVALAESLRPVVVKGDARNLKRYMHDHNVQDGEIKLVCTHPPYLDSLKYTVYSHDDLSHFSDPAAFCDQIQLIAKQIYDMLAADGHCCVLMGDIRKNNETIPLAFYVLERFLREDFKLKNTIIKTQHKDSSTRFWYSKNEKLNFLITHEYLFILSK